MPLRFLLAALALAISIVPAAAQNIRISDLPSASSLTGTEKLPIAQSGTTRSTTPAQIGTYLGSTFQPLDSDLSSIAALSTTSTGRNLLTAADAAAIRTQAGLVIGTNVQAFDSELAAIAGLTSAADRLPYFTGSGTASLATFSAYARTLIDDADATAARSTLGLGSIATQASSSVSITGGSITGITDLAVADGGTGSSTASGARSNLGAAASGTNADITQLTGLTRPLAGQHPGYVAGRWYVPGRGVTIGVNTVVANTIRFRPIMIEQSITISDILTRIGTTSAGGNIQLAVYASDASARYPTGPALGSSGSLSTASAATVSGTFAAPISLTPGLYWVGINADNSTAQTITLSNTPPDMMSLIGATNVANVFTSTTSTSLELRYSQTFGTWPDLTAASFTETVYSPVAFALKVSAVP
jgi:hypothetical protein